MTNEEILANAPEGATHFGEGLYFKANAIGKKFLEYSSWNGKGKPEWWLNRVSSEMHSLSDIRRIVELESELDKAYNDLANFEGYPEEVSALRHDIERRKQRYKNILLDRAEWKKRAEAAEKRLAEVEPQLPTYEELKNAFTCGVYYYIESHRVCRTGLNKAAHEYAKREIEKRQLRQQLNGGG